MKLNANISAFLFAIRKCEGTDGPDGYRMLFGGDLFEGFEDHPDILVEKSGYSSTAAGAYQILYKTWDSVIQPILNLPDFSAESQDTTAVFLIKNRGALEDIKEGRIEQAVNKCNKEWASLPGSPYGQPVFEMESFKYFYDEAKSKADIERVHKIDDVNVSSPIDLDSDLAEKKVQGENKGVAYYALRKDSRLERIFDYVLDTIAGKNKAGKGIGKIKDAITWIFPTSKPIDLITDEIGDFIKSKRSNNTMETTKEKIIRIIKQPSTKAAITGILTALGLVFGMNVDAAGVASTLTQSAVGVVTGVFGIYFVYRTVRNLFTDDAKETANK